MRSYRIALVSLIILAVFATVAAAGEGEKSVKTVTQATCATGTCASVPTTYTVRQTYLVPTTVESVYELKAQNVIAEPAVAVQVCQPKRRLQLPKIRLFGGCCN
jgi:hypothetical protein